MNDGHWVTNSDQRMPISRMKRTHIKSAIAMIKRTSPAWRRGYLPRLELELRIRDVLGRKD